MTSVGWATLEVIPSVKGIAKELDKQTGGPLASAGKRGGEQFGTTAGRSAGSRFGSVFSKAAKASMLGLAGASAIAFKVGKDSIEQASELGESLNAVNVSYGKQAKGVKRLGEQAADSLGLSNSEFNSLAVRFSAFSSTIAGGEGRKVVTTLDDLTTRASDFASVMNLDVADAAGLFQSGLAGETEPLRQYGIDLSAAAVEAHALAEGIASNKKPMTEAQKVQARYSLLMQQTAKTQGDFANTSDSLANRQRILNARWDDARAKLGNALLPAVEDITGFLLDRGIPAFEDFSAWFTKDGMPAIKKFAGWAEDELLPVVKDVGGFLKTAAERGADLVEVINNLPKPAKYAGLTALLGGGAALKMRGGKGALGSVGSALGMAKPVPVFVTNKGFGGGGLDVDGGGKGGKWGTIGKTIGSSFAISAGPALALYLTERGLKKSGELDPATANNRVAVGSPYGGVWTQMDGGISKQDVELAAQAAAEWERLTGSITTADGYLASFDGHLDLVGNKKVNPDLAIPTLAEWRQRLDRFYELEVKAGNPIEPNLKLLGYEPAMDKLYKLQKLKIGDKTINIHAKYVDPGEPDWLSGGGRSVDGARANGGRVNPRSSYLVGERGPEIFRPDGGGSIIPNHEIARGGAGVQINIDTMVAQDYRDMQRQLQRRAQKAAIGGFGG